jgi:hypothetical protein
MSSKLVRSTFLIFLFGIIFLASADIGTVAAGAPALNVNAPTAVSCADFSALAPGASVEGLGTVHPDLNISGPGDIAVIAEGQSPAAYGSSAGPNAGLGILEGFSDIEKVHEYEFTFAPDVSVSFFSLRMLDYGDLNKALATEHSVTMLGYDSNGFLVGESGLVFTSDAAPNPTTGSAGNLQITGDATAEIGEPGNFVFSIYGTNITRLVIQFASNSADTASDPNHGYADLCFEVEGTFDFPETTECVDFNAVTPGQSVEGLGVVNQYLNISSVNQTTVSLAENVPPAAYGSPGGLNFGMGALSGFAAEDKVHGYTFTFAPDISVNFFTLRMLDYGDLNKILATQHNVTLEAYDSNNFLVSSSQLNFASDPVFNPTSSSAGNLQITGDATASLGNPGNYVFAVGGEDIVRLELKYSTNLGEGASDPNHGLAILCFSPNLPQAELDPPTAALELIRIKQLPTIGGKYLVHYACSENAPNLVSATINGYDVLDGQQVNLVVRETESARIIDNLLIWLFAPEFSFDVTCADANGNQVSTSVVPDFSAP